MTLKIIVALLLLALLIYLAAQLLRPRDTNGSGHTKPRRSRRAEKALTAVASGEETRPCPLCDKQLYRGERVHSVVYTGGGDRVMHIMGCPYCYPGHQSYKAAPDLPRLRKCPRCGKALGDEGYLVARVFEKEKEKKEHVHVLGCQRCRYQK